MSDNTYVSLTIRKVDFFNHEGLFDDATSQEEYSPLLMTLEFHDVDNANLGIERELQAHGIPYDKAWDPGDEYPKGVEYGRVLADGSFSVKSFVNNEENTVNLDAALKALDNLSIASFLKAQQKEKSVIDWSTQEAILANLGSKQESPDQNKAAEKPLEATGEKPLSYKVVAMNTAHLSGADRDALVKATSDSEHMVFQYDTGFLVKLFDDEVASSLSSDYSSNLKAIVQAAYEADYRMIEFDEDAPVLNQFPTFCA